MSLEKIAQTGILVGLGIWAIYVAYKEYKRGVEDYEQKNKSNKLRGYEK
mgnify:CR=1 FL=1